jgi:hypothetical protein
VAFLRRHSECSAVMAQALIMALLVGALPLLSGVIITRTQGAPAFTLNICHPLPGLNHGSGFSAVPLVEAQPALDKPSPRGAADDSRTPPVICASEAPDPPPPKLLG